MAEDAAAVPPAQDVAVAADDAKALENKAAAAKQEVENLRTEAQTTLASLGNIGDIIDAEKELDNLRTQLQELDEENGDYAEQKAGIEKDIEDKQEAVEELIVKAFIENSDIKGTDVCFT
ncbi:MAG: hypothetical protein IJS12_03365 [Lachnospiraceae bacterium]|nr:hypothetical protein [Lachnospiraceae bacterium]